MVTLSFLNHNKVSHSFITKPAQCQINNIIRVYSIYIANAQNVSHKTFHSPLIYI